MTVVFYFDNVSVDMAMRWIESELRKTGDIFDDLFSLNSIQKDLIIDAAESLNRVNNGFLKWHNKYSIEGDVIFGFSPNALDKNITNIFTETGIYHKVTGANAEFITYSSKPNFNFKKASFLGTNKLIDDKSGFIIDLVTINPENESGQKILNTILGFIKSKSED